MLFFMEIVLGIMGAIFFVLGLILLRKKTIFLRGSYMVILITLCYLPTMYRLGIRPILRGDMEFINWIFAIMLIFMIFIFKKSFGAYNLFNITEDRLYDAIFQALREEDIQYIEKRGKILLESIGLEIKISTHAIFNTANIHFKGKNKEVFNKVMSRVKIILSDYRIDKIPLVGILYIVCALFLWAVLIWILYM